jgi:hypothetical protein
MNLNYSFLSGYEHLEWNGKNSKPVQHIVKVSEGYCCIGPDYVSEETLKDGRVFYTSNDYHYNEDGGLQYCSTHFWFPASTFNRSDIKYLIMYASKLTDHTKTRVSVRSSEITAEPFTAELFNQQF